MKELRCPHCNRVFTVDESEYADLLSQVRNESFQSELERRIKEIHDTHVAQMETALAKKDSEKNVELGRKDSVIADLKKDLEHSRRDVDQQVRLAQIEAERKAEHSLHAAQSKATDAIRAKEDEIRARDNEITRLKNEALLEEQKRKSTEEAMHKEFEIQLREKEQLHKRELELKDEEIAQYRDFKARQSTKMIGESLEVFCKNQYELMVRPYLPTAVFGKDNDVVDHTKGDFVFRDYVDGVESVSIMFEMKNEADDTQTKHKNADFFKKLDADRTKKNCEYAVLVSMLELDNDLYNNGIYYVAEYEKMYVVRPQQFLAIISLLVHMGRSTVKVKKELSESRNKEIDVTNFETKLEGFKNTFSSHVTHAYDRYNDALKDIDNTIAQLNKVKEDLQKWIGNLDKANNKLDEITIRKLTYNNRTMKAKFNEARQQDITEIHNE